MLIALVGLCSAGPAVSEECLYAAFENEFSKRTSVFGIWILGTSQTPTSKISHAAHVMAQYLDNDEDGFADDPAVLERMQSRNATLVMFANNQQAESTHVFENLEENIHIQDLYGSETHPGYPQSNDQFDAALEEVLHLITSAGWSLEYPAAFGEDPGSLLTDAMDTARGGRYQEWSEDDCDGGGQCALPPGGSYSPSAWYTYDDDTCSYRCMATEYFYWALTSMLGAQAGSDRLDEIEQEWALNTEAKVASQDPAVYEVLTSRGYALPSQLPDGNYTGGTVGNLGGDPCSDPEPVPEAPASWGLLTLLVGLFGFSAARRFQADHSKGDPA